VQKNGIIGIESPFFLLSTPIGKSSYLIILSFSAFFEIKGPGIEYCLGTTSGEEMVKKTFPACTCAFLHRYSQVQVEVL